jgi:hypothetical protein
MIRQRLHFLQADLILDIETVDANMEEQDLHAQFQQWQRRFEDSLFTIIGNTAVSQEVFVSRRHGRKEVYQIVSPSISTPEELGHRGYIYMAKRLQLLYDDIFLMPPENQVELVAIKVCYSFSCFFIHIVFRSTSNTSTVHNPNQSVCFGQEMTQTLVEVIPKTPPGKHFGCRISVITSM